MLDQPKRSIIKTSDGYNLLTACFEPDVKPIGVIQVIHGFGEYNGSYSSLCRYFTQQGFVCVVYDQRGHGEMSDYPEHERRRKIGILKQYDCFLDDVHTVREKITGWYPGLPVFLYGHSMGANIAVNYLLKRSQSEYNKTVLETPWLRLHTPKPKSLVVAARVLGRISHTIATCDRLGPENVSRDPSVVEQMKNDQYYHNRISLRIFTQISDAGEYAIANASELTLPTLLLGAEDDKIVCPKAIREFANAAGPSVTFYEEPKGYHVLHSDIEPTRGNILKMILDFLCV